MIFTSCLAQSDKSLAIDSIFKSWNQPDVPGAAIGIVQHGKLIFSKGYGIADLEHDIRINPTSVFYIGSVSKQFVTFCILLLEEQGKLNLDDRIQKYLPDFPEYESPLTIRHFIHHTSGVRDYLTLMYLKGRNYLDNIDVDEVYELIKNQKDLNFTPGEKHLYSNSCYFMLALIVEKASGKSIKNFAKSNIFDPLGMNQTLFYDNNKDLIKNRVFSYQKSEEKGKFDNLISRFDLVGSGGVYSTIEDLYLWDQNFYKNKLGKGGQTIIKKMHEEGKLNNGESSGYAFALNNNTYKGLKTVSHGGALAGYRAQLVRFPEQNFSVILLANRGDANPSRKCYQIADLYLKDQFIVEKEEINNEKTNQIADSKNSAYSRNQLEGDYELQPGMVLTISVENDSLHAVQNWNNSAYNIVHNNHNLYEIPGNKSLQFIFSVLKNGSAQVLTVVQNGKENKLKRKIQLDTSNLISEDYVGDYICKELNTTYSISLKEKILSVKIENTPIKVIQLYGKDQFIAEGLLFRFVRKEGNISGFELDAGRVQNLKFVKN